MKKVGVINVPIGTLKPNPKNPRKIEEAIEPVAKSIAEFGFLVPIVVNDDSVILSGHARLEAAKSLGLEKVPIVVATGLTQEQQTAFMLADNRLGENASYDSGQLAELLKELTGADYDVLLTGFQSEEIEAFITSATDGLDDILGLGDDDDEGVAPIIGDTDEEEDVRHMHRLMFLINPEQKAVIMEALDGVKKSMPSKISNGEALTLLCSRREQNAAD